MTTGSTYTLDDGSGAVRVEDLYDTTIDDLWQACTVPERLARWIGRVEGDLQEGGTVHAVLTSTWTGPIVIENCEAPHHLLLTLEPGTDEQTHLEVWLSAEADRTRLVVEERGLPRDELHFYGAGWQVHLEDLGRSLRSDGPVHPDDWSSETPAAAWSRRWSELTPAYQNAATHRPPSSPVG